MRSYVVRQGDYLAKIAALFGVSPDAIWEMPQNKELKDRRDPNILAPGDVVRIPERAEDVRRYGANRDNRFQVEVPTVPLKMVFSEYGKPLASEDYEVHGMGRVVRGKTDGEGRATLQVRADVDAVEVRFAARKLQYVLRVGYLDPVDTELGVAQRLARLRYLYIPEGATGPRLRARLARAIALFQRDEGLEVTGQRHPETIERLLARWSAALIKPKGV